MCLHKSALDHFVSKKMPFKKITKNDGQKSLSNFFKGGSKSRRKHLQEDGQELHNEKELLCADLLEHQSNVTANDTADVDDNHLFAECRLQSCRKAS